MKLLFLMPQLPYPPQQGTALRNFNILRGLAANHDITLLCYIEGNKKLDLEIVQPLTQLCSKIIPIEEPPRRTVVKRVWQMARSQEPDLAQRLRSTQFDLALRKILAEESFDIIQIEGIELAWALMTIRSILLDQLVVFDAHNAEAQLQKRTYEADLKSAARWPAAFYSLIQGERLQRYEKWACAEADWVTAVSQFDKNKLLEQLESPLSSISVIPNSIDVLAYENQITLPQHRQQKYDFVFTGKMDYRPNVDAVLWFAEKVWPIILERRPRSTWVIVGQKPHKRLTGLKDVPNVTITGWVRDVKPFLLNGKVFIMPFRIGSGTRLKLIEAMAAGIPVVSTSLGIEGYPVENDKELLIVDSPSEMADLLLNLLDDPDQHSRLVRQGHLFARRYDWRQITPKFEEVYYALAEQERQ